MTSRPYSELKIFKHPQKLEDIKNEIISSPIYVRIKPTNICNHNCYYCSYADKNLNLRENVIKTDSIDWNILKRTINELADIGTKAVTFSGGGEPLVYPKINDAMKLVLDRGMDLSIITNGQNLNGESADILKDAKWVRISVSSNLASVFSKTRGVPEDWFISLCRNIREFSKIKNKNCELGINCVVNHLNANQIYNIALTYKYLGVNHVKYAARITKDLHEYHSSFKDDVINQITRAQDELNDSNFKVIDKYKEHFDLSAVFQRTYSKCPISQIITVIAADGKVYLCHDKAYVPGGSLGDLNKNTFKEIWESYDFKNFDAKEKCKHHCIYDSRNILINNFLDMNDEHINFI